MDMGRNGLFCLIMFFLAFSLPGRAAFCAENGREGEIPEAPGFSESAGEGLPAALPAPLPGPAGEGEEGMRIPVEREAEAGLSEPGEAGEEDETGKVPQGGFSVPAMFLDAAFPVRAVMIALFLASLFTWVFIMEKFLVFRRCGRVIRVFEEKAREVGNGAKTDDFPGFTRAVVEAGLAASRDTAGGESRAEYRERVEKGMKAVLARRMEHLGRRAVFLATVGAISPFVGLFGTVWGIMDSFMGIAATGETTLAVVAPGIAEALFSTALGLVTAIPAVIGYNIIVSSRKKLAGRALAGIGHIADHLAGLRFAGGRD
jgi:biopolymer transport protein ExbB/TolQ